MELIEEINSLIPASPAEEIPWERIDRIFAGTWFPELKTTRQNLLFHGEDDVYTHTKMVCRELVSFPAFYELSAVQRTELFLAAVLHDIGKARTTVRENGEWVSPHHASVP